MTSLPVSYDPDSQRLFTEDVLNLRELGGMPLNGGKDIFRNGLYLRSGSPNILTGRAHELLVGFNVRTVIDLRSESAVRRYGNPFKDDGVTEFLNIPLFVGDPDAEKDPTMDFLRTHHLGDFYVIMLEELGERICRVFDVLLDREGYVLFHCAHGKDRTGVIAALLYLIAGASRDDIIRNYEISYEYAKVFLDPLIEAKDPVMRHTLRSDRINMEILLSHIDKEYGGNIDRFFIKNGFGEDKLQALREKVTVRRT